MFTEKDLYLLDSVQTAHSISSKNLLGVLEKSEIKSKNPRIKNSHDQFPSKEDITWEYFGFIPLGVSCGNPVVFDVTSQAIIEISKTSASTAKLGDKALRHFGGTRYSEKGKDLGPDWENGYFVLQTECRAKGVFYQEHTRGPGLWLDDEKPKFHDGKKFVRTEYHCYVGDPKGFIQPQTGNLLEYAQVFFIELYQAYGKDTAIALLGYVVSALAGGSIDWRSHIWLTGQRGVGKTTVWKILKEIFGGHAVAVEGRSSAAGIRQQLKASARPVLVDEAEPKSMRGEGQGLLMLARSSSSGSEQVLGTPDGKGFSFRLNSSFCFGSINPPDLNAADASRFHVIRLGRRPGGREPRFLKGFLGRFGQAILHALISDHSRLLDSIESAKDQLGPVEERLKDTIGTLIGSATFVMPSLAGVEFGYDKSSFAQDDAQDMLHKILSAQVRQDTSMAMSLADPAKRGAAEAFGVKIVGSEHGKLLFISGSNDPLKKAAGLAGNYLEVLSRLPGARKAHKAKVGGRSIRGLAIPLELCEIEELPVAHLEEPPL